MGKKYLPIFSLILILTIQGLFAQEQRINPHDYGTIPTDLSPNTDPSSLVNDDSYDVKFYHIDVEIGLFSPSIHGSVLYIIQSNEDNLESIKLDLDAAFTIDSFSNPVAAFSFIANELSLQFDQSFAAGDMISFKVYYHGVPPLAGGYKGLRYETHDGGEPIIASLSTPYLAHTWWPCKDGVSDKSDSTFIDITIQDTSFNDLPVIAVSNGLLDEVEEHEGLRTFKWKHYYPIVPYYVMVAISNYDHFQQNYSDADQSFPIDYYVFKSHKNAAMNGVAKLPDVMSYFSDIFGPYPFPEEKYGMTQLGYYGGIENQTNSIINNMSQSWFYVSVHELAHQWFADLITCESWNHGWLNEGFASYAEALYQEHDKGFNSYQNYMVGFEYYDGGSLYMNDISDPFSVFQSILYNKGPYVLHMLRGVLGDDIFFESLKTYATDESYRYGLASTEDFQSVCEAVSGMDLSTFFDQWIYDQFYPQYNYNYAYDGVLKQLHLTIHQDQFMNFWRDVFEMPIEIGVSYADGTDTLVRVDNHAISQGYFIPMDKEVLSVELDPDQWILKSVQYDPNISLSTSSKEWMDIQIFPNPTSGDVHLQLPEGIDFDIQVYDLQGKKVDCIRYKNRLNLGDIPEGSYVIAFRALKSGKTHFEKIMCID